MSIASYTTALLVTAGLLLHCPPVLAGGKLGLNHIWSRLADLNGELGSVESAEFSPDSRYIVSGTKFDNSVRIFRTADGHQLWEHTLAQEIERVAWTRDGRQVCSVSEDGMLNVFDVDTGRIVFSHEHGNGIDGLSASHDGKYLVTGRERINGKGVSKVFRTGDWSLVKELPHPGTVNELDFSSDDKYLAAAGDFHVRIWRVSDWKLHKEIKLDKKHYFTDAKHIYINTRFNPDDSLLAVGATQGYVYFIDVDTGEIIRRMNKSGQKTETVEWTKDGRYFLVAGHGSSIDFFKVEHILNRDIGNDAIPYALRAPVTDSLEYMDFNAAGTLLTTAHQDGTVQLWTFMSDDPLINQRRHRQVRAEQDAKAKKAGKKVE
ncbi:WD40 repeat domain-containing protein [Exilibacterium tricleocarpae]|nr:PQQ-binding-like beta-propeller repeat protein [Exilibacterium tricleocarpae]